MKRNNSMSIPFNIRGDIYNVYSINGRIHYYYGVDGVGYGSLEFRPVNNSATQNLVEVCHYDSGISGSSVNHSRWVYIQGSDLKIYKFDQSGDPVLYGTVASPNGSTITAANVMGTRITFKAGTTLYCLEGDPDTAEVKVAGSNVKTFICRSKILGEIKNDAQCWVVNGPVPGAFYKLADNVVSLDASP